eukprot:gene649-716_t
MVKLVGSATVNMARGDEGLLERGKEGGMGEDLGITAQVLAVEEVNDSWNPAEYVRVEGVDEGKSSVIRQAMTHISSLVRQRAGSVMYHFYMHCSALPSSSDKDTYIKCILESLIAGLPSHADNNRPKAIQLQFENALNGSSSGPSAPESTGDSSWQRQESCFMVAGELLLYAMYQWFLKQLSLSVPLSDYMAEKFNVNENESSDSLADL